MLINIVKYIILELITVSQNILVSEWLINVVVVLYWFGEIP